jgi:ArsR family transcriptional regulator
MSHIVTFCHALADVTRWRIVRLVMNHALCVCELADILEMPQSSVSSHVQVLRKAGLLESEKCGKWTYFQILPEYRKLILNLAVFYSESDSRIYPNDDTRCRNRLAIRATSCCPGPSKLPARNIKLPRP